MKNKMIFTLLLFFLLITGTLGSIKQQGKGSLPTIKSSILNKKYISEIDVINLRDNKSKDSLIIKKQGAYWVGKVENQNLSFPVSTTSVLSLLEYSSNVRNMYKISDSVSKWQSYGLTDDQGFSILFDGKSSVYFGIDDITGKNIYLRSGIKNTIYKTKNDFFPFLFALPVSWADMKLFPEISLSSINSGIAKIELKNETSLVLTGEKIENIKNSLLETRGGNIISNPKNNTDSVVSEITISFFDNSKSSITIYKKNRENNEYYVIPSVSNCNYALEISEWTYQRLLDYFRS